MILLEAGGVPVLNKYLKVLLNGGAEEVEANPLADGLKAYEANDWATAQPLLTLALESQPHAFDALMALGRMHLEQGELDAAYPYLRQALDLDMQNAKLHYHLGELNEAQGNLDGAEAHFLQATRFDPEFTDAHIRLGMTLAAAGRPTEAVSCFDRAIFLDRGAIVARFHLATLCLDMGDHRRALAQLHLVKEREPEYPPVYVLQGRIFSQLGDHRQAILEFEKAAELGAADAHLYWLLGCSHEALGQTEPANKAFAHVLEHDPDHAPAHFKVGMAHMAAMRLQPAKGHLERLLGVPEYQAEASAALARIEATFAEIAAKMVGEAPPAP